MDKQMQTYLRGQKNDMRALKQQAEIQNKIQMHALQVAVDTNAELKSINQTLNAMGFVMQDVAGSLQRQEKMHAEHYDAVKKEKALKEVLYNFKKFHATSSESGDAIVGASGARILSQMVAAAGFSTKDLSEIADKEYFDARMSDAKKLVSSLAGAQHQELDDFEYAYGAYQYLSGYDLAADNPFVSNVPAPQMPAAVQGFPAEKVDLVFQIAELEEKAQPWKFSILGVAGALVVGFFFAWNMALSSDYNHLILLLGFYIFICVPVGGVAAMIAWSRKVATKEIRALRAQLPPGQRKMQASFLAKHLEPLRGYASQLSAERKQYEAEYGSMQQNLETKKAELAATINSFIKAHPGLAEFYPPVG